MYEEKVRKFKCYYCPDCKLYAGSETKIVHGRRMKPNTKYCTGGKKITIFRSDDPKVNVPKWCPKRRVPPTLRIYHFRSPEIEAGENMLAANGISFFPYPSRYAVRYEGESPYTAMDFARQIKKRPLAELLSMQLLPYEILEIDDGIRPYCFLVERLGHVRCIRFKSDIARESKYGRVRRQSDLILWNHADVPFTVTCKSVKSGCRSTFIACLKPINALF